MDRTELMVLMGPQVLLVNKVHKVLPVRREILETQAQRVLKDLLALQVQTVKTVLMVPQVLRAQQVNKALLVQPETLAPRVPQVQLARTVLMEHRDQQEIQDLSD